MHGNSNLDLLTSNQCLTHYFSYVHQWFINNTTIEFKINGNLGVIIMLQHNEGCSIVFVNSLYVNSNIHNLGGSFSDYEISFDASTQKVSISYISAMTVTVIGYVADYPNVG